MGGIVDPGRFHRLGVAVRQRDGDVSEWFTRVLGAEVAYSSEEPGDEHVTTMLRIGSSPLAVFAAPGTTGSIGRYVERYGPGLHSLAWRVRDLWATENLLRQRGVTITGTNVAARHFFMHPKETFGMLIEWTDQRVDEEDPGPVAVPDGAALGIAWVTAVVRDVGLARSFLEEVAGGAVRAGLPAGPPGQEDTVDLAVGDMVVRLVSPRSAESRYAGFLDEVGERLHSMTLLVGDLGTAVDRLAAAGVPVLGRDEGRVFTDPRATLGLRMEWVGS